MHVKKGRIYCVKHPTKSKHLLVIANGKKKKVSKSDKSETNTYFESFLISYTFSDTMNNNKLMLSAGEEYYFTREEILYECGSTQKRLFDLVKSLNSIVDIINEQYFDRGSTVYYVSEMKDISVYIVNRYKYNAIDQSTDMYLVSPLDSTDYLIVGETTWRNPMRVNRSITNLTKLWESTKQ